MTLIYEGEEQLTSAMSDRNCKGELPGLSVPDVPDVPWEPLMAAVSLQVHAISWGSRSHEQTVTADDT